MHPNSQFFPDHFVALRCARAPEERYLILYVHVEGSPQTEIDIQRPRRRRVEGSTPCLVRCPAPPWRSEWKDQVW